MKKILTLILIWLISMSVMQAKIINVPADQPSIQAGINAALFSDTILVCTGRYVENIDFNGKNIVVGSLFLITGDTSYISQTVIDGNNLSTVVTFENGENNNSVLIGFTITSGSAVYAGGGIKCSSSNPTLRNLRIWKNTVVNYGGGIYCSNSSRY